jgi:hypothetical protein
MVIRSEVRVKLPVRTAEVKCNIEDGVVARQILKQGAVQTSSSYLYVYSSSRVKHQRRSTEQVETDAEVEGCSLIHATDDPRWTVDSRKVVILRPIIEVTAWHSAGMLQPFILTNPDFD